MINRTLLQLQIYQQHEILNPVLDLYNLRRKIVDL